jgi:hypothetical protein
MGNKELFPVVGIYTGYFPKEVEGVYVPLGIRRDSRVDLTFYREL